MSVNLRTFFALEKNYTLDELKNARNTKINSLANTSLTDEEKQVYAFEIIRLYKKAKRQIIQNYNNFSLTPFNNMFNQMQQVNNMFNQMQQVNTSGNFSSQSKSYNERRLSDGTRIIIETIKTNNNGQTNEEVKTYKILPNGTKQEIDYITNSTSK